MMYICGIAASCGGFKTYTMQHWRQLQDKEKLGSWDLLNENGVYLDKTVTIKGIKSEKDPLNDGKTNVVAILDGCKPMILNTTNCKSIEHLYGFNTQMWIGKKITIYVKKGVHCPSGKVDALRIREQLPTLSLSDPMAVIAQKAIQDGKRTLLDIKKSYTVPSDVEKFLLTPATPADNEQPTV